MALGAQKSGNLSALTDLAVRQFAAFGRALKIAAADLESPRTEMHGTFLAVRTDVWIYDIDMSGNQTFRPTANYSYMNLSTKNSRRLTDYNPYASPQKVDDLIQTANSLAISLDRNKSLSKRIFKKETLVGGRCGGELLFRDGRFLTRLSGEADRYFQVIFDRDSMPIRIDTNIQSDECKRLIQLLFQEIVRNERQTVLPLKSEPLTFGTFFSPMEYRFESGAHTYEGEDFLQPAAKENPFKLNDFTGSSVDLRIDGHFDAQKRTDLVDHAAWRKTDDYRFWKFYFWNRYGRIGGVRGNWIDETKSWELPNIKVEHHNLEGYRLVGGDPTETKEAILSDGKTYIFPFAISRQLDFNFYKDLENCTVAAFTTHGGPIQDRFQLARGRDIWFMPATIQNKLGRGNLRHLIFESCGAMGCFKEERAGAAYLSLASEWLPATYVNGLRTACGGDGEMDTSGCGGWSFFEKYNKGSSISDSWLIAMVNESASSNNPVTVSYGATLEETLSTLADGRFSSERASAKYSAASVWVS